MSAVKRRLMFGLVGSERFRDDVDASTQVVVAETAAVVDRLTATGTIGRETTLFVPRGAGVTTAATLVEYDGEIVGSGGEMSFNGDFFLQHVKYGVGAFVSMVGPTAARIEDTEDLEMFLDDADRARQTGTFPAFLASPPVQLADEVAFGRDWRFAGPDGRLFVDADGNCRTSPQGAVLGDADDEIAELQARWRAACEVSTHPCSTSLSRRIPESVRADAVRQRPWLGLYLDAIGCLREATARQLEPLRISGFGGTVTDIDAAPERLPISPIVGFTSDSALIHQPRTGTSIRTSVETGKVAEILCWSTSFGAACELVPEASLRKVEHALASRGILVERLETAA